jgi:hypothetical protein
MVKHYTKVSLSSQQSFIFARGEYFQRCYYQILTNKFFTIKDVKYNKLKINQEAVPTRKVNAAVLPDPTKSNTRLSFKNNNTKQISAKQILKNEIFGKMSAILDKKRRFP